MPTRCQTNSEKNLLNFEKTSKNHSFGISVFKIYRKMKLVDVLLLSASVGFLVISIYEIMIGNFASNYWLLMLMLICLFVYGYRKNERLEREEKAKKLTNPKKKK
jgi:amino acid transporter